MKLPRLVRRAPAGRPRSRAGRRIASGLSLGLVATTLVVLAVRADGTPISDVDLHDGSVWVTNQDPGYQLLGRLNPQIRQLDLGIQALSGDFDVFQNGSTVFLDVRSGARSLRQVDVAAGKANDPIVLSATTVTAFGDDTVAMLDTETGAAWVRSSQTIQGFAADQTPPDLEVGRGGAIAVGTDGTAYVVSRDRRTVTPVEVDASGLPVVGEARDLGAKLGTSVQMSVVGDLPVVYDADSQRLLRPDAEPLTIESEDPTSVRLQQPGPRSDVGYVATRTALLTFPVEGDGVTVVRDGYAGPPAAPVVLDGYVHAAWADPAAEAYLRLHGDDEPHAEKIPKVAASARLVFRTNRDVVVLNDVVTGLSWLVQEPGLPIVDNWDDVDPTKKKRQAPDPDPEKITKARRTEENRPPTAIDDELGARPGQDSILPVTRNDVDLDGDILTVAGLDEVKHLSGPKPQQVAIVGDGTQLQLRFGPNDGGKQARFSYGITDGREAGTDDATLTVTVVGTGENTPPEPVKDGGVPRRTAMTVLKGERSSAFVLPDWTDADGDSLVLQSASTKDGGTVTFRPDGVLEYVDDGRRTGEKVIDLVVSDGHEGGQTAGKVYVNVSPNAGVPPALTPDRAVGQAGTDILVAPLLNDFSRDGSELKLRDIVPQGGLEITPDPEAGTFVVRTSVAGTYYLDYSAYSDRGEAVSFVRLDVLPASDEDLPPVAMKDEALIPPGGFALVDLLANDHDPEAGVLAVTAVHVPRESTVKASLLQNRMLRISSSRDLLAPVSIGYTISDGTNSAEGSVTVGQATQSLANRPPVAEPDRVTVRAGAVASIGVLDNDFDPDGDDLLLHQQDLVKPEDLPLFVSGDDLRFRAPDQPGQIRLTYGVRDSRGQRADTEVVLDVIADDPDVNAAPRPDPITARAVGERPVRIDVDLRESDPDGDAVSLKGLRSAPRLGRITATGLDWIEYQPYAGGRGGTDTFTAEVQDKYGLGGVVDIRVGVVPRASTNQAPVALDDRLLVRPDRTVQYNVLANDSDPDGDPLVLSEELQKSDDTDARVSDGFVTVQVPPVDGPATVQTAATYSIGDGAGGTDSARLTVDASEDAPLYAPITRDDSADLAQIAGKSAGEVVRVDVLANDGDLDGRREDLRVEAFDGDVSSVVDNQLDVRLAEQDQVVVYEVRDGEDNQSYGFVFVSGTETVPPVVDPGTVPIEVVAGEPHTITLADHVLVRAGRTPILTVGDEASSSPFAGGVRVESAGELTLTAPKDFAGPAAVTLEVTDGASLNDPTGLTSFITLPVDVEAKGNKPPTLRDVEIQLVGGDEAEQKTVDLAASASDPNADDVPRLTFTAESTDEVEARVTDRSMLVLDARGDVEDGVVSVVPITVEDPKGATAEAVVRVTIVRSDKPVVTVGKIGPLEAEGGEPVSFDINSYATNPYEGEQLTVADAEVESGEGSPSASGSTVTVTPSTGFAGTLTVRFTVRDGSDDPERDVTARAEITVVDRPTAPGRPTIVSSTHDSVRLTWAPSDPMGAPITEYVVQGGGSSDCGAGNSCLVTGLTPGDTYRFSVTAVNRVDESDPSDESDEITPDEVPDVMAPPVISQDYTARDGELSMSWTTPNSVGSAIEFYEIHRVGSSDTRQAKASPFVWEGLTNGSSYEFEVRAVNKIVDERKQAFSDRSAAATPFGVPDTVARPEGKASADDGIPGGTVEVTWSAPADDGDPIDQYAVTMFRDGAEVTTKTETGTSSHFDVENGHDYTFTVKAHNRAGFSEKPSDASEAVNPYDKSTEVRNLRKVDEGDRSARVSFDAPADPGGRPIVGYRISSDGGGSKTVDGAGTHDVSFGANNGPYTVTVVPITQTGSSGELEGASAAVGDVRPFGAPGEPAGGGASSAYKRVDFSGWSSPGPNGRPVLGVQYRRDGEGGWADGNSTSWDTNQGGDGRCIFVRTVAEGRTSGDRLTSGERRICGNALPRKVNVTFTNAPDPTGNCSARCDWVHFNVEGFAPGTYSATANQSNRGGFVYTWRVTVGSNGLGSSSGNQWYTGFNEAVTVTVDNVQGTNSPPAS